MTSNEVAGVIAGGRAIIAPRLRRRCGIDADLRRSHSTLYILPLGGSCEESWQSSRRRRGEGPEHMCLAEQRVGDGVATTSHAKPSSSTAGQGSRGTHPSVSARSNTANQGGQQGARGYRAGTAQRHSALPLVKKAAFRRTRTSADADEAAGNHTAGEEAICAVIQVFVCYSPPRPLHSQH